LIHLEQTLIRLRDIEEARERLAGVVQQTPCQLSKAFSSDGD
jgi:threonine dehydratase